MNVPIYSIALSKDNQEKIILLLLELLKVP
jgi:hypothetical protein